MMMMHLHMEENIDCNLSICLISKGNVDWSLLKANDTNHMKRIEKLVTLRIVENRIICQPMKCNILLDIKSDVPTFNEHIHIN